MIGVEFSLRVSSAYSIRVPYSYQCARTYPLPAPSTIKGLCANALWRAEGGNPLDRLKDIHKATIGAASRSESSIAVSTCTVRVIPMNALLRQFAFTPRIDCMILFRDGAYDLAMRTEEALRISAVYLGDSESLVTVLPQSINSKMAIVPIGEKETVEINSSVKFKFIKSKIGHDKSVVLYMQDDPCEPNAALERYLAPLISEGDSYRPMDSISFISAVEGLKASGDLISSMFFDDSGEAESASVVARKKRRR